MATAHLLCGFICAGKTTFGKSLESKCKAVRFCHDEWMRGLFGADSPEAQFAERFGRVERLIRRYAEKLLVLNVDVILDFGFWSRASREEAINRVLGMGGTSVVYYLQCSEEEMRRRLAARTADLPDDALFIDEPAFDALKSRFEPPGADEEMVSSRLDRGVSKWGAM